MKPKEKVDLYHRLALNRPDAERREMALRSYLEYPFVKCNKKYSIRNDFLFYDNKIKITADLLTGSDEIIDCVEKIKLNCSEGERQSLEKALDSFCSVVYTIGNCCPVRKNKGGRKGDVGGIETCWYKLGKYLEKDSRYPSITSLLNTDSMSDLNKRTADNMFAVFPQELSGQDIIRELLLKDYYNKDFSLIEIKKPNEIKNVFEYIEFLNLCTKLIVQRGIRISLRYKDAEFDVEVRRVLFKIFEQIGLPYDNEEKKEYLLTYEN